MLWELEKAAIRCEVLIIEKENIERIHKRVGYEAKLFISYSNYLLWASSL